MSGNSLSERDFYASNASGGGRPCKGNQAAVSLETAVKAINNFVCQVLSSPQHEHIEHIMGSSFPVRQTSPLLAITNRKCYSVLLFHSSRTRSSGSHSQQRHAHLKGYSCNPRPLRRQAFMFVSALATGFTTALLIHKLSSKNKFWCPVWLLKAWLRAKWRQLCQWPTRLRIWAKRKWRHMWFGKLFARGSKEWWKDKIARREKRKMKRKAAQRRKQEWAKKGREGFAKGKRLFRHEARRKKPVDDGSIDTEQAFKEGKKSKKAGRGGSEK